MVALLMEKKHSSLLSSLFPWQSPFVIKFAIVKGGLEVQLFRNNRRITSWRASKLKRNLPVPLLKWIEENHLTIGPQPYPLVKQLWHNLTPLVSKKLLFDASELASLQETSQPPTFALTWKLNYELACIEGSYNAADNYLGMGWFQKGTLIWPLKQQFPQVVTSYFENLTVPLGQASTLLNTVIPALQPYFAARADFQLITNFAVNIVVLDTRNGKLTLTLDSNYPHLLKTLSIFAQEASIFLAQQALIPFPRLALTPVLMHLLQGKGTPVSLQGEDIPLFIAEQLPTMRRYYQISEEAAQKITQANPIVNLLLLQPSFAFPVRTVENGIGKYSAAATYQHQNHTLNMKELLDAQWRRQRFVNQQGAWFEWPKDSYHLAQSIRQSLVPHILQPAELMGLAEGQQDSSQSKPIAYTIQPEGTTPSARAQTLFKQLQHYGIPGGIFGDPPGLVNMLLSACENLVHDNRQARILWLTTSHRKGGVTRAIADSNIQRHVKVASLVTLRDEPNLLELSWTLVVFHALDRSQDNNPLRWALPRLKWQWALLTVTSQPFSDPFLMQTLHLPEQYGRQFCERYLFDPTRSYQKSALPGSRPVSPAPTIARPSVERPTPIAQANTAETPRQPEPTSSRFSTHEVTILSQTAPVPPATPRIIPSPALSFWEQAQHWKKTIEATLAGKRSEQSSQTMNLVEQKAAPAPVVSQPPTHPQISGPTPRLIPEWVTEDRPRPEQLSAQPQTPVPVPTFLHNAGIRPVAPAGHPIIELDPTKIAQLHEESEHLQVRLTVEETAPSLPAIIIPPVPAAKQATAQTEASITKRASAPQAPITHPASSPPIQRSESKNNVKPLKETEQKNLRQAAAALPIAQQSALLTQPEVSLPLRKEAEPVSLAREAAPVPHAPAQLDQGAISKLWEESEHLQERLTIEQEGVSEGPEGRAEPVAELAAGVTPELAEAPPVASAAGQGTPEVDEDWQDIYPQWNAEHWSILRQLYQGQALQRTEQERRNGRPISMLIDEINLPVDEQLNDLLIDTETQTLFPHLRATVEHLVRWYYSLESR
jgi:hypothetical protein